MSLEKEGLYVVHRVDGAEWWYKAEEGIAEGILEALLSHLEQKGLAHLVHKKVDSPDS